MSDSLRTRLERLRAKLIPGCTHYFINPKGEVFTTTSGEVRQLKHTITPKGYLRVTVKMNGKPKHIFVHALVLLTFVSERPLGLHVAHLDGDKKNNNLKNLAYVSAKENEEHKKIHGTKLSSEKHRNAKLTWKQVNEIRTRYAKKSNGYHSNAVELGKEFGVRKETINRIVSNRGWKTE